MNILIEILIILTAALLGAILNRIRGGLRLPKSDKKFPLNKLWLAIAYGLFIGLCFSAEPYISWYRMAFVNGLAMWLGYQMFGWGSYIGALTVGAKPVPEVAFIDEVLDSMKITFNYPGKNTINILQKLKLVSKDLPYDTKQIILKLTDFSRAWGFMGLLFRGLIWSFLLGLPLNSIEIMLTGALMPICYLIPTLLEPYFNKKKETKWAWNWGEYIFGFWLVGSITFILSIL